MKNKIKAGTEVNIEKKYAIYYREIPAFLDLFIIKDGNIKFVKDGLKEFSKGHRCPRMSVIVEPTGNESQDRERLRKLEALLDELQANNQIVGYSG